MHRSIYFVLLAVGALTGCSNFSSQPASSSIDATVTRGVVVAEQTLTALERAALHYTSLPTCGSGVKICADPTIKSAIKSADTVAYNAVVRFRNGRETAANVWAALDAFGRLLPHN